MSSDVRRYAGINSGHMLDLVIRPTLARLAEIAGEARLSSEIAVALVFATGMQESHFFWMRQYPAGPARGFYQIEPRSHDDLWDNFLAHRPQLAEAVAAFSAPQPTRVAQLSANLCYATAICRLIYWRAPDALPTAIGGEPLARFWKRHFNTESGKGEIPDFLENWRGFCAHHFKS